MNTVKHPIAQMDEQIDCGRNVLEIKKRGGNVTISPHIAKSFR